MSMQELKTKKKNKKKVLTILMRSDRQDKLLKFFKDHIGQENAATQRQVFTHLYGKPENYSELQLFFLWTQIRRDMNWLRRTTNCFIGSSRFEGDNYLYYVIKDWKDAKPYIETMKRNIKKCKFMMARCEKAVEKKFYKKFLEKGE